MEKEMIKLHNKLVKFLEKENCKREFFKAAVPALTEDNETYVGILRKEYNYCGSKELISTVFTWAKTPEGFDFWCNISDKWEKLYQ